MTVCVACAAAGTAQCETCRRLTWQPDRVCLRCKRGDAPEPPVKPEPRTRRQSIRWLGASTGRLPR